MHGRVILAPRNDRAEIESAWGALASLALPATGEGWQSIPVGAGAAVAMRAGRHAPGGEEAFLIDLVGTSTPSPGVLPQGGGFITETAAVPEGSGRWLCLSRRPTASLEIFTTMIEDVVGTVHASVDSSPMVLVRTVLDRVHAWQLFMDQAPGGRLSEERELGLIGELHVLSDLLKKGHPVLDACFAWTGAKGGLHDFRWPSGALEVKSTTATGSFPARIGSLDQLDDAIVSPLVLVAIRATLSHTGVRLPDHVAGVRSLVGGHPAASLALGERLISAGYHDSHAQLYSRRIRVVETRCFLVDSKLARLVRANVPSPVVAASYTLDLDSVATPSTTLATAFETLGLI